MKRILIFSYGLAVYAAFFATFLYLIGFVEGLFVPHSVDAGGPESGTGTAILINVLLITLFGVQHTIMARPRFKRAWAKVLPAAAERSTFVLATVGILVLMFFQWRPIPEVVWSIDNPILANTLLGISFVGWAVVLLSTFLIDHFDLFGLRQVVLYALGKPYTQPRYVERGFYRHVRHPLMLGFLIAFWSTPVMTQSHLLFAGVFTTYILLALQIEEKTLVYLHGDSYRSYQKRVPMLLPSGRARAETDASQRTLSA